AGQDVTLGVVAFRQHEAVACALGPAGTAVGGVFPGGVLFQAAHVDGAIAGHAVDVTGVVGQFQGRGVRGQGVDLEGHVVGGGGAVTRLVGDHRHGAGITLGEGTGQVHLDLTR